MDSQQNIADSQDEKELVELAKTDDSAFKILYERYFGRIYGFIFKRTGQRETTEDLVSDIFMKVFCNLKKYKDKGCPFKAWLYRVATNRLYDYYRHEGKRKEVDIENIAEPQDLNAKADDLAVQTTDSKVIRFVLNKLSDKYQKILILKFFEELEYEEIASVLDITVNNARVIMSRALDNFQNIYKKYVK